MKSMIKEVQPRTGGYVLVSVLALGVLLILMVSISSNIAVSTARATTTEARKTQAFYAAQSGVERVTARISALKAGTLPTNLYSSNDYANWFKDQLMLPTPLKGTLPGGGSFRITAEVQASTSSSPAELIIYSQGFSSNDSSSRRIRINYPVAIDVVQNSETIKKTNLSGAPAALTTTGSSTANGGALIAGDNSLIGSETYNMACPVQLQNATSCARSPDDPDSYILKFDGVVPSNLAVGAALRPQIDITGYTSEERYVVTSINKDPVTSANPYGETATLKVLSDYLENNQDGRLLRRTFSPTGIIPMKQLFNVPAVMMPAGTDISYKSNNLADMCLDDKGIYECSHYSLSPDELFEMIMGGTKDEVKERFKVVNQTIINSYVIPESTKDTRTSVCSPNSQWVDMSQAAMAGSSASLTIKACGNPRLVVVDARGLGWSNNNNKTLDINIDNGSSTDPFKGLLYVIADSYPTKDQSVGVKITSNYGFAGAMVVDNGLGGIDLAGGTGSGNTACAYIRQSDGLKVDPKLCFDRTLLDVVNQSYEETVWTTTSTVYALKQSEMIQKSWAEVGQ